jgi:Rrf2 family cysteine metabolism transcriptional repressor
MFSAKAHYGLKGIIYLAKNAGKGPIQAKEIASTQNVPVRYLELLLSQLKKARLIDSNRGKMGGYFLTRPASSISVLDVIMALEGRITFISGYEKNDDERIEVAVSNYWKHIEKSLIALLREQTVDDLLQRSDNDNQMYYI